MQFVDDLVSVIMPAHNAGQHVGDALASVLDQTYRDLEVLVTDDASNDHTVDVVEGFARQDPRIDLVRHPTNLGAAASRNASIRRAKGRFLAFCDADDRWQREKLSRQLAFMASRGAGFSFTAFQIMDAEGRPTGKYVDLGNRAQVGYEDMLRKKATLGCSTVILDRQFVTDVQMPPLRTGQDYATWLSILRNGHQAYCLDEPLSLYRITPGSLSRNKFRKARRQWGIYRQAERLGLAKSAVCFASYAINAVFRP